MKASVLVPRRVDEDVVARQSHYRGRNALPYQALSSREIVLTNLSCEVELFEPARNLS